MTDNLPNREYAERMGWTHQVEWIDKGRPCFVRCRSGSEADAKADAFKKLGCDVQVIDLRDALQLH